MKGFSTRLLCGTAALLIATTACSLGEARYKQDVHTHISEVPQTLKLDDPVGAVTVAAWSNRYVEIDAVKHAPSPSALDEITIAVEPAGDTLNVAADLGSGNNRSVDFTIHVPASTNLRIDASVGDVRLTGFTGNVTADASVGRIRIGMATLAKGQHVDVKTSVGEIDLTLPRNADATINADTSVGNISGNVTFTLQRSTTGANGRALLGRGGAAVTLSASTGTIHVNRE